MNEKFKAKEKEKRKKKVLGSKDLGFMYLEF